MKNGYLSLAGIMLLAGITILPVMAEDTIEDFLIEIEPYEPKEDTKDVPAIITTENGEYEVIISEEPASLGDPPSIKIEGNESDGFEVTLKGVGVTGNFEVLSEDSEHVPESADEIDDGPIPFTVVVIFLASLLGLMWFYIFTSG